MTKFDQKHGLYTVLFLIAKQLLPIIPTCWIFLERYWCHEQWSEIFLKSIHHGRRGTLAKFQIWPFSIGHNSFLWLPGSFVKLLSDWICRIGEFVKIRTYYFAAAKYTTSRTRLFLHKHIKYISKQVKKYSRSSPTMNTYFLFYYF